MSVGIPIHDGTYKTWAERAPYFEQLQAKVAEVPGVTMAAISSNATPPSNGFSTKFEIVGATGRGGPVPALQHGQPRLLSGPAHSPAAGPHLGPGRKPPRRAADGRQPDSCADGISPTATPWATPSRCRKSRRGRPYLLTAPGADGWPVLIVGVVARQARRWPLQTDRSEAFVPYTAAMGMYTQILVRSQVPPLTLAPCHPRQRQLSRSRPADQQRP